MLPLTPSTVQINLCQLYTRKGHAFSSHSCKVGKRGVLPLFAVLTSVTNICVPLHTHSAAGAGALASWITNPVDLVRLRLQVQRGADSAASAVTTNTTPSSSSTVAASTKAASTGSTDVYKNTWDGLVKISRKDGLAGLFKGSGARIAFFTPSTMISMSLYDECKKLFKNMID